MGAQENNLALAFLANGNVARASELAAAARSRFEGLHDERWLAHVQDTAAQIAVAEGHLEDALAMTAEAIATAERTHNHRARMSAIVTRARVQLAMGDDAAAMAGFEQAAGLARELGPRGLLRDILSQWADVLARSGQHEKAYALTREALAAG